MADEEEGSPDDEQQREQNADAEQDGDEMDLDDEEDEDDEDLDADEDIDHHFTDTNAIKEVQDKTFDEVQLKEDVVNEVQSTWQAYISNAPSREIAAEGLYAALFDSAPSLQGLFKTPRAVMSIRILNGIADIIGNMHTPTSLKISVETFGFQHLDLEVTVPRVVIFRDAIVDLLEMELGAHFTSKAKSGWLSILNYVGGAFIYVRVNYSERLKIIASSWATANNKVAEMEEDAQGDDADGGEEGEIRLQATGTKKFDEERVDDTGDDEDGKGGKKTMKVPTTFNEMFMFNGAVMGFGNSTWMKEVLEVFDDIVNNVSNSYRLQETCDTLGLVLAKYKGGEINLAEFKSVMLASLRSLVPKDWGTGHEVAWSWLWENVERMLKALMGKPKVQEKAVERFILHLTEDSVNYLRRELYKRFFALAPAGQDFFKQSTTRLYWIADKVVELTIEMYREPKKMVNILSAIGLRHVGYGVLTEFFAPYVTGAVEVVRSMTNDETAQEGFKWSISLIARILVRTVNEGSTIVMKAVNTNAERTLRRAVSIAPRGKRALWMLNITVGTQSISPLYWAIESGSLATANAMIKDLLVIRADRDNYYYGCDDLFDRHPEIIQRLCADAPALLPTLMDGLVWRSRVVVSGERRVNYYIKHLMQDSEGNFNQALEWLVQSKDPKIICHPVVMFFSDLVWNGIANRYFLFGRLYFLGTLVMFLLSQSILHHLGDDLADTAEVRYVIFACRCIIYLGSMGQLLRTQVQKFITDCRARNFITVYYAKLPAYLSTKQDAGSLTLLLILVLMCTQEPIFWCSGHYNGDYPGAGMFSEKCPEGKPHKEAYTTISMFAMALYWLLLIDLTIFSMRISAYVLMCGQVLSEVALFLFALVFLIGTFASAVSTLDNNASEFVGLPRSALSLTEIALRMFDTDKYKEVESEPTVLIIASIFIIMVIVFLLQLLVAQLIVSYASIYSDMVGYARINRGSVIVKTMLGVTPKRWSRFLTSLGFEERLEFNEGDIGLAGGIQVMEPANANPTTKDTIVRIGGSTHPSVPWPEEKGAVDDDDEDKFDRLDKQLQKVYKKLDELGTGGGGKKKNAQGGSTSSGSGMGSSEGSE